MNPETGVGDDNRTAVNDDKAMKAAYCDWIEDQRGPDGMARPAFIDVWRAAVRWAVARRDVPGGREADAIIAGVALSWHLFRKWDQAGHLYYCASCNADGDPNEFAEWDHADMCVFIRSLKYAHAHPAERALASHPLERADSERDDAFNLDELHDWRGPA